jgi:hypothetical protein
VSRFLALIVLALLTEPVAAATPAETLAAAEASFAEGTGLRHHEAKARPRFAQAAAGFDELWNQGFRSPELALNRSRAHRLAGNLPKAIASLHDGLAAARFSQPLWAELADARAAVAFPIDGELSAQCRPHPRAGVSTRMSRADAWILSGGLWLVACAAVARFAMTRNGFCLIAAGIVVVVLLVLGGLWVQDERTRKRDEALPLLIVSEDVVLRRGNAEAYPPRLDSELPRGAEVRELSRRGGWVQVQLSGGAVGWLPESAVIGCG